jgi:hypothetical protein
MFSSKFTKKRVLTTLSVVGILANRGCRVRVLDDLGLRLGHGHCRQRRRRLGGG